MEFHRRKEEEHQLDRVHFKLRSQGAKESELQQNPLRSGVHHRGYLPHVKREGASYFVTFRLPDSLPREVLVQFEREQAEELRKVFKISSETRKEINRDFQRKLERFLDQGAGECHLRQPEIARLVRDALLKFEGDRYLLDEWVVMPNHVHVVVWPAPNHLLSEILKSWKTFTGREANKILKRTGSSFWQRESFDHWIRNEEEKARIRRYIRNNPVDARLCTTPEAWPWSSAWQIS